MDFIDESSDEETFQAEEAPRQNARIQTFRRFLAEWKKRQLDTILGENQDTLLLNSYSKKMSILYYILKESIENETPLDLDDETLQDAIGELSTLTPHEKTLLLDTLFRDLVEFRFTYDTDLIDNFRTDEALSKNILPNDN